MGLLGISHLASLGVSNVGFESVKKALFIQDLGFYISIKEDYPLLIQVTIFCAKMLCTHFKFIEGFWEFRYVNKPQTVSIQ